MKNKAVISIIVIVVVGCLLISVGLIAGAYFLFKSQKAYTPPTVVATEPPSIDEQMDQIQQEVQSLRGLSQEDALDRALMTSDELKDVVINDFFKDYTDEDSRQDALELSALGLLEPGFNLLSFYQDLYSEQIAGFYDSETKEMNVISDDTFGGLERMTYAHEYTHVLQDQNYDMQNGLKLNDDYCETETEYCSAVSALVEGDATLSEQYWFLKYSTDLDKTQVSEFQQNYSSPVYDSAPDYMKQDFLFPYSQGFDFVNQLYSEDGWDSIDEAYQNPPVSTEQILHPEKYPSETPIAVEMPDMLASLPEGWFEVDWNVMGEWYTYLVLGYGVNPDFQLDDDTAKTAAAGWGGDAYVFYTDENVENYALAWHSTWDASADADEFFSASIEYGKARWGDPAKETTSVVSWSADDNVKVTMRINGNDVLWVVSTEKSVFDTIVNQLADFGE